MDVKNVTSLLKILSWQKILQAVALILIVGLAYSFWENRITVYNSLKVGARVEVEQPLVITLSPGTTRMLEESTQKMNNIVAVQVINVNFKKNSRNTAYFASGNPAVKAEFDEFQNRKITDTTLFNSSEINNQKIINLINGEFVCNDFKDTVGAKLMPKAQDSVATVCSISIPPFYGRFSGYLNIYLSKKPTLEEISMIKQVARDLSLRIYETDVDKTSKYTYEKS
jgi:hypothetical protein